MTNPTIQAVTGYLAAQQKECAHKAAQYKAESRDDEANFMRVRNNVYGIFQSLFTAHKGIISETILAFEKILTIWTEKRQTALAHQDHAAATIEDIKLDTAHQIQKAVRSIEAKPQKECTYERS